MSQETTQKSFQVSSPARLDLSNIRGSVDIRPGEDDLFQVTAIKHTDSGDAGNTQIEVSQAANRNVTVATHFPDGWWLWLLGSKPCRVDYVVKMPRNSTLRVRGVSNTVLVDGFSGDFDFQTVSGDLTLQNLTGPLQLKTVSGKIFARNLTGKLNLTTVSGDMEARESQLSAVQASTTNGNLGFQTALLEGPYRFNSVSGNVALVLPPEARCSAEIQSVSGKIATALPVSTRSLGHGRQVVDLQGGGALVTVQSVSGNLRLSSTGDAQSTGNVPPAKAVDRRVILERLERGEIKPDEALAQMRS
jgi:hypothetical protein